MKTLKIVGFNMDIQWKNKQENFSIIERKLNPIIADLFVLPEMFSTGFCMDASEIADAQSETLAWMQSFAHKKNTAIAGSVSVKENDKYYNRFYFVQPDGSYDFYDKRHLFSYSGEDQVYTQGKERKIVEYKGFRILLQVCYDLRFPVFSRNTDAYDLAIYVANWPVSRVEAWNHLLKARAIENQCFVLGINRIGVDGNQLEYTESSHCFFADGSICHGKKEQLVLANLEIDSLKKFRERFRFLADSDDFQLKL